MKVMTLVGTRPELIRLSRVIDCLDRVVDHVLVHTGQNDDPNLIDVFFSELKLRAPSFYLGARGSTAIETIANIFLKVDEILESQQPDAVLVLGDTNSALSVICAKRRKIPIFHMEAGNRSFDQRVPEEINRKIVDHISDVNLTYTEHARRNLLSEGLPSDRVFKVGSPQKEVLDHYSIQIHSSSIRSRLGVESGKYFVASFHREENVDRQAYLEEFVKTLNSIVKKYQMPVLFSVHPRTRLRLETLLEPLDQGVMLLSPLGLFDYVKLQCDAYCVLSDSGTITEESSLLGFPAVNLREAHERPEGVDEGVLIMTGINRDKIISAIDLSRLQVADNSRPKTPSDYLVENCSWKVVKVILSYTDYINRIVWHK